MLADTATTMSSEVVVGPGPGGSNHGKGSQWHDLADQAVAHRGEWVSVPLDGAKAPSTHNTLYRLIAHRLGVESSKTGSSLSKCRVSRSRPIQNGA